MTIDNRALTLRARGTGRPVTAAESFDAFVLARSRSLLRTTYLLTQDHSLAEDLVQTALAKAWFAWSQIEGGDPEPYVRKVLVNTYSSWWRRRWNGEHPTDQLPETVVPASAEERTDVWQALQRLPRRQRAVVVLRFYEDLSEAETTRATESDDRPADLLDGVHRKITRTRRRRFAVGGAAVAVIAALAFIPALTNTSAPEPADPPSDYVKDGITLPGVAHDNTLDRGWIGREGENSIEFTWTPTVQQLALYPYCRSGEYSSYNLVVQFNGYMVHDGPCTDSGDRPLSWVPVTADSPTWLSAPVGKPVQVKAWLAGEDGRLFRDERAQLAVGLYTPPDTAPGAPAFQEPAGPGDYIKDGVRYRAQIGGDKLAAAAVGNEGQSSLKFRYTASGAPISLRIFCTASAFNAAITEAPQYEVAVKIGAAGERISSCYSDTTDAGTGSSATLTDLVKAGQTHDITVRLVDAMNRPVSIPRGRIGLGIYEKGAQRNVDGTTLDEVVEFGGSTYKLASLKTADATKTKTLTIDTPADNRFLISYGSSDLGPGSASVALAGLSSEGHGNSTDGGGVGIGIQDDGPRPAGTVTLTLTEGTPSKGRLILATYVPQ